MQTSQSARTVMREASQLGSRIWPKYSDSFSRHDFTLAQLFACLVVGAMLQLSYRKLEQFLRDSPDWLSDIGMSKAPDHNTLWRALRVLVRKSPVQQMLELLVSHFKKHRVLKLSAKPLALDSTYFERHHRSAHYDRRCRQMRDTSDGSSKTAEKAARKRAYKTTLRRRRWSLPKLALAVASGCHLILAAKTRIGNGSDAPDFYGLLYESCKRAPVKTVVADAGYDSEANHQIAREYMSVRSIIAVGVGRRTSKLPTGRWRRQMAKRFARKADQKLYGQRSQSETVHSMLKRNMGSALRSRKPHRRKQEMLLHVLTHDIMLLAKLKEGGD